MEKLDALIEKFSNKSSGYILDLINKRGDLTIEDDYIICQHCDTRYFIEEKDIDISIKIKEVE